MSDFDLHGLRILALTGEFPPYRGGIGTYAYNMADAAAALGAKVTVLAPDYGSASPGDAASPFKIIRFPGGLHSNTQLPAKTLLARATLRAGSYDVLHAVDWPFFIPLALTAKPGPRLVFTVHGSDANDMARRTKRIAVTAARVFSARAEIVANSAFTLGLLRRNFPAIRPKSLRYEYLGVAEFWRTQVERSDAERVALGLPVDKFILLTVGRLTPRKGQLHVVEALKTLPEEVRRNLLYLIVGPSSDHAYTAKLDAAIAAAGFEVRRLPDVANADVRRIYSNADAFCLVVQDVGDGSVEGFGLVYLEAGSQGLPSIASPIQAAAELVLDGENGLLAAPDDPAAIAAAVRRLMQDETLRKRLGEAARTRSASFSWARCAANTYGQARSNAIEP